MIKYSHLAIVSIYLILLCCTSCSKTSNLVPLAPPPPPPVVINRPPVAESSPDRIVPVILNSVFLWGQATDPDGNGDIVAYRWNKISGPAGFSILSPTSQGTTVLNLEIGEYLFEFAVRDRGGLIGKDTVKITVDSRTGSLIHNLQWVDVSGYCGFRINGIIAYLPPTGEYEVYISPKYNGILTGWGIVKPFSLVGPGDSIYYEIINGNLEITVRSIDCSFDDADSYSVGIIPR